MNEKANVALEWRPDLSPMDWEEIERLKEELRRAPPVVRRLRQALGLSQAEVAAILETTQSNVSKIEARQDPPLSILRRLAEAKGGALRLSALLPDGTEVKLLG